MTFYTCKLMHCLHCISRTHTHAQSLTQITLRPHTDIQDQTFLALPHNFINKIALLLKNYIIFLNKELVTSFLKGIKATASWLRW